MSELLQLIPDLRQVSGTEYEGPCPLCEGGKDRFCLWTDGGLDDTGRYYCRRCEKSGNAVALVMAVHGMSEAAARVAVGLDGPDDWKRRPWTLGVEVGSWAYTDEQDAPLYRVVRYEPPTDHPAHGTDKTFLPYVHGARKAGLGKVRRIPYGLSELKQAAEEGRVVVLVEGERHADELARSGFVATTTVSGSGSWRDDYADHFKGAALVAILRDHDEPGLKYAHAAARSLMQRGVPVRIIDLHEREPERGQDVLDWLAQGGTADELRSIIKAAPEAEPVPEAARGQSSQTKALHTNGRHATDPDESGKAPGGRPDNVTFTEALTEPTGERDSWWHTDFHHLATEGRFIFAPTGERWPGSSVDARLPWVEWTDDTGQTKAMAPTKLLMRHRTVEQLSWLPGAPQIVEDMLVSGGGRIPHKGAKIFNLYRPPTIMTGSADKARPWRDHVHKLYPGEADHFFAWNAHRVQRPGEKINHALVLGGAPGIGKDCILEPIKMAVGPHNFEDVSPATVVARFNGFLRSVILRVSEARDMGDVDRYAFYEHMKTITAAPPDMLRIDEKHAREFYIPNVTGVIYTTNHKASGIYLPPDDRRHFVAWSEATQDDFSEEYFDRLWKWYEAGGYSHVAAYLHEYDLSGFNPKAPPTKTQAFWEIVDAGRAPEDAELADALDLLEWPAAVTITDVADRASPAFQEWLSERRNRRKIPHRFESAGYVPVRNDGAKDGLWKIGGKRQAVYALKTDSARDRIAAANALIERPTVPF